MKKGGNAAAKTFFTSHGVTATDMGRAETKYHCRAAEMYKTHIKKVHINNRFIGNSNAIQSASIYARSCVRVSCIVLLYQTFLAALIAVDFAMLLLCCVSLFNVDGNFTLQIIADVDTTTLESSAHGSTSRSNSFNDPTACGLDKLMKELDTSKNTTNNYDNSTSSVTSTLPPPPQSSTTYNSSPAAVAVADNSSADATTSGSASSSVPAVEPSEKLSVIGGGSTVTLSSRSPPSASMGVRKVHTDTVIICIMCYSVYGHSMYTAACLSPVQFLHHAARVTCFIACDDIDVCLKSSVHKTLHLLLAYTFVWCK
jgi:hypothetical protein